MHRRPSRAAGGPVSLRGARRCRPWRDARVVIALLLLPGLVVAVSGSRSVSPTHEPEVSDDYDWAAPKSHRPDPRTLSVGVTHTQYSIDQWGDDAARNTARAVLTATATYQNQHIFGWGAANPEPSPGVFDWSTLDRRMALIRSTGGTPVITLCCAPDWMKGGRPGQTDWSRLEAAPSPEHYADFAALAAAVARRYPDVRHFQVWNELKGFWDKAAHRWDYEAYTNLYNAVYDALKAVDSRIAVGGPYVVVEVWSSNDAGGHPSQLAGDCGTVDQRSLDVLEYWLRHKHGADFLALDASSNTRDDGPSTPTTVGAGVFDALTRWVQQRTSLPVWWSEFHVGRAKPDGERQLVASAMAALLGMADAGAAAAFVWQPQRDAHAEGPQPPALWTSTMDSEGGRPLSYAQAVARLQEVLADRAAADPVSWPVAQTGLVSGRHALLFVHTGDGRVEIEVRGRHVSLGPYEVRYVPLRPGSLTDTSLSTASTPTAAPESSARQCLRLPPASEQVPSMEVTR